MRSSAGAAKRFRIPGITKLSDRIFGWAGSFSLKSRLIIVFSSLMIFAIGFCFFIVLEQHHVAMNGSQAAIDAHADMVNALEMREALSAIQASAAQGQLDSHQIERFRRLTGSLAARFHSPEDQGVFRDLRDSFSAYVSELESRGLSPRTLQGPFRSKSAVIGPDPRFEDVSAAVGSVIKMNEHSVYRMADQLRRSQDRAIQMAVYFLLGFMAILVVFGSKLITNITSPLTTLARFLDNVDIEENLPSQLPSIDSGMQELSLVARSFEQLLQRLRGYRALNVRRLLIEKRRADLIAASIADGIILLRAGEVIYVNPTAERILGSRSGGPVVPGLTLDKLASQGDQNPSGIQAVIKAVSRTIPVELTLELEDRKAVYLIQAYPISFDLLEQFELPINAGASSNDRSLDRFQADTLVLAQDMTLVREGQDAKSHFLATLSHEIKTPVTSLTMATRLLKRSIDQVPNPAHKSLILTCVDDVDRLRSLLDDFLTISRFDTLTQKVALQTIDLNKILRHTTQSFQLQASEKGIQLAYQGHPNGGPVMVPMDPTKVTWALSNLMLNALRHTPRDGKVEIRLENFEDRVEVKIKDTGPGIERSRQERIFDKFNPFYDIRVARSGSAGVGLAIAREIVVAHGGRIWVMSDPGRGAEFCFTLPKKGSLTNSPTSSPTSSVTGSVSERSEAKPEAATHGIATIPPDKVGSK